MKRNNGDQNNISIDLMMSIVDAEENDDTDDESEEMWNRLNNAFGRPWCMKCNKYEGHSKYECYDSNDDSVEDDDDSTYVDEDNEENNKLNEIIDLTQSYSNENEENNNNDEEENNDDENDSVEVIEIEHDDDSTVDTAPINYDNFEEEEYPHKRNENNELTQEEWKHYRNNNINFLRRNDEMNNNVARANNIDRNVDNNLNKNFNTMKLKDEKEDKKREADVDENLYKYLGIKRTKKEQKTIDNWNYAKRGYIFEDGDKMITTFENFRDVEHMKTMEGDNLSE